MELLKDARHLQSNPNFMSKIEETSKNALSPSASKVQYRDMHIFFCLDTSHYRAKGFYSKRYVSLPWEGVLQQKIRFITVGRGVTAKGDNL